MKNHEISVSDLEAAERVVGVTYTEAERTQMLGNIETQIAAAVARRGVNLPNSAPTAQRFDPRPAGFRMPEVASGVRPGEAVALPLPANAEDIAFAPVQRLGEWLASGTISSRRLTEIYLDRIAAIGPRLECFATVMPEEALAVADAADREIAAGRRRGPLHGIPYGLKDIFDTKGTITGWGAEPYRARVPEADSRVATLMREAGAVLIGKTSVGALAYGDIWYGGVTRNPWNLNEGSSGSSAGSASAVAAGLCGFAVGTETLGSITMPSHRCGATGLRPTFGRVSRRGCMALSNSLDKVGPICRAVADTALVLAALNGADPDDRFSIGAPFGFDAGTGVAGLRVGYLPGAFGEGATDLDHLALETVRRAGIEPVACRLPDLPYASLMNVVFAETAAFHEDLTLDGRDDDLRWQDDGAWPNVWRKARFLSAVDHVQLDRLRYRVMEAVNALFTGIDVLIGPPATGPMLIASNFTGHPCLQLPVGLHALASRAHGTIGKGRIEITEGEGRRFRVPHGISLWGPLFDEGKILQLGLALERAFAFAGERPGFAE